MVGFLKVSGNLEQNIDAFCRFAEAAEDQFIKGINVEISEIGDNFFVLRFTCQPQGIGFAHMIHGLPQTEGAGTGTFVGQIDVKIIVNFIKNRHSKNSFVSI